MSDNYNKITATEVILKYEKVISEVKALKAYLACFEREWDIPLDDYKQACDYDTTNITMSKNYFEETIKLIMPQLVGDMKNPDRTCSS